jgi:hypothetical protein
MGKGKGEGDWSRRRRVAGSARQRKTGRGPQGRPCSTYFSMVQGSRGGHMVDLHRRQGRAHTCKHGSGGKKRHQRSQLWELRQALVCLQGLAPGWEGHSSLLAARAAERCAHTAGHSACPAHTRWDIHMLLMPTGLGGSMHFYNRKNHFYGGNGIVGAQVRQGAELPGVYQSSARPDLWVPNGQGTGKVPGGTSVQH